MRRAREYAAARTKLTALVLIGALIGLAAAQLPAWDAPGIRWLDVASQLPSVAALTQASVGTASVGTAAAAAAAAGTISSSRPTAEQLRVFLKTCGHSPGDRLGSTSSNCVYLQQQMGCGLLEAQGYLSSASGAVRSFVPDSPSGNFSIPGSCSPLSVQQTRSQLAFDGGGTPVLAVIGRGASASQVFFLGSQGADKGHVNLLEPAVAVELCLAPAAAGTLQVSQTASYSPGLTPGSVGWQLTKSVQLPPAFTDGTVHMFQGDTVEAAWTLAATKSGEEATRQGLVSGTITLANSRPEPVAVFGVLSAVKGGPSAGVTCGPSFPFKVPACSTVVCKYTAQYPQLPSAGWHQVAGSVQYQADKGAYVGVKEAAAAFEVGHSSSDGLKSAAGRVAAGQAVVTDSQLPGQRLPFSGSGQQSYVTPIKCPASGSMVNSATLLASTGQEVTAAASVLKNCYELGVRLADVGDPAVARWQWSVQQTANAGRARLQATQRRSDQLLQDLEAAGTASGGNTTALQLGADSLSTTADVTFSVRFTRTLPKGLGGAAASPFTLRGSLVVTNPAPINARLAGVAVTLTDPAGQSQEHVVAASCPLLTVASGQSMVCAWTMAPPFNPIGGQLTASARYIATLNGAGPSGEHHIFKSAPFGVGMQAGGAAEGSSSSSSSSSSSVDSGGHPQQRATFGSSFTALATAAGASFHRRLLQWISPAGAESSSSFDAARFLSTVWGFTGATTVVSASAPPVSGEGSQTLAVPSAGGAPAAAQHSSRVGVAALGGAKGSSSVSAATAGGSSSSSSTVNTAPVGLMDDCADITAELGSQPGLAAGRLVSGVLPSGRVCGNTTFVYTVRYGPYDGCGSSRATTTARLATADTRRYSSSLSEVAVDVAGCRAAVTAAVAAVVPSADLQATWTVQLSADHARLQLQPRVAANTSYTAAYQRHLEASAPRLWVLLSLRNAGTAAQLIGEAGYQVNMTCGGAEVVRANAFACAGNKVPAAGSVNCSFVVPLPCAAKGSLQARLQLADGSFVTTPVAPFDAPDLEKAAEARGAGCVEVSQGLKRPPGLGSAVVVAGRVPTGRLCKPETFRFTRQLGPYASCGSRQVASFASLRTQEGVVFSDSRAIEVAVTGCQGGVASGAEASRASADAADAATRRRKRLAAAVAATQQQLQEQQHRMWQPARHAAASVAAAGGAAARSKSAPGAQAAAGPGVQQLPRGSCVHQPWFWKQCMLRPPAPDDDPACAVVSQSLPGGLGARTPFFPYRRAPLVKRTYRQLMVAPRKTGNALTDLHFRAAQVYIAAQMNAFWGVAMPPAVRAAFNQLGQHYLAIYDDRSAAQRLPQLPELKQQVEVAVSLLADFSAGRLPGLPTCAAARVALKEEQQQQQQARKKKQKQKQKQLN